MSLGSTQLVHGWIDSNLHLMGFVSMCFSHCMSQFFFLFFGF